MKVQEIIDNLKLDEKDKKYLNNYLTDFEEWYGRIHSAKELFKVCEDAFCEDVNDDMSNNNLEDLEESLKYLERYVRILKALRRA